jgi:hypothetical protein
MFWKRMPTRTYILIEEQMAEGFKVAKDQVTVMLDDNANRDYKRRPVVIDHAENPRAVVPRLFFWCHY